MSEEFKWSCFHRKRTKKYQRRKNRELKQRRYLDTSLSFTLIPMHVHKGAHLSRGALLSLRPLGVLGAVKHSLLLHPERDSKKGTLLGMNASVPFLK